MGKIAKYLKESWYWIVTLVIGILMIFIPNIAQILNWSVFNLEKLSEYHLITIVGVAFCIVAILMLVFHFLHLRNYCIIKVDGMKGKKLPNQKSYYPLDIAKQEFDCYSIFIDDEKSKQSIYEAYCEMKGMFKTNNEKCLYDKYLFYGYTYTPFLFMLGQMYSDNRKYYCFHMQQTNQSTKRVRLKRKSKDDNNLIDAYHENNKETLIIRVGTTVTINNMNISQFGETDVLDITSNKTGTEVIDSIDRLNDWCDIIVKKIRNIDFARYSKIILLLATSAEMVFLLGKRLSKNSDPNFYVYHYDVNAKNPYPWALASKMVNDYDKVVYLYKNDRNY